jgi:hypothetical protein
MMTRATSDRPDGGRRLRCAVLSGLAMMVVGTMGLLPIASASGIGAGGGSGFGVAPSQLPSGQARPYFTESVAPGHSAGDTAVITNQGSKSLALAVSASIGTTAVNSGSSYYGSFKPCVGTGCWVSGLPTTLTLAPGESTVMPFTVTVPASTGPGQYLAGITAKPAVAPAPVTVGSNGRSTAHVIIVNEVTVGVAVDVGDPSQFVSNLRINTITAGAAGTLPRLFVGIHNGGQTFLKSHGTVTCTDNGKSVVFPVTSDTVLPSGGAVLVVNAPGLEFGSVASCQATLAYGTGLTATWSGAVTMPAVTTPPKTVHVGPGDYAQIPGTSPWVIVLIVVSALVLVALLGILVALRRRRRDPGPPAPAVGGASAPEGEGPAPKGDGPAPKVPTQESPESEGELVHAGR